MSEDVISMLPDCPIVSTTGQDSLWAWQGAWLVLYFYPRDHTPGCTTEATDFAEQYASFRARSAEVVGVSRDTLASHRRFQEKWQLPFPLIADPEETLCQVFGVMKKKTMYGKPVRGIERSTFIFDPEGHLVQSWRAVKVPGHVSAVLSYLESIHAAAVS